MSLHRVRTEARGRGQDSMGFWTWGGQESSAQLTVYSMFASCVGKVLTLRASVLFSLKWE